MSRKNQEKTYYLSTETQTELLFSSSELVFVSSVDSAWHWPALGGRQSKPWWPQHIYSFSWEGKRRHEPHPPRGRGGGKSGYPGSKTAKGFHQTAPTPCATRVPRKDGHLRLLIPNPSPRSPKRFRCFPQDGSLITAKGNRQVLAGKFLAFP